MWQTGVGWWTGPAGDILGSACGVSQSRPARFGGGESMHRFNGLAIALAVALGAAAPAAAMMSTDPTPTKSRAYLDGERAVKAKEYAKAIPLLEQVINSDPRDADAYNLLGYSFRNLGNKQSALAYYQRALQLNPNHRGANEYLGQLYLRMGKMKEAQAQLAKLQKICGRGCEEYESLRSAIAKAGGRS
jgi:tetratricopeptide (TPR) repeat protein